MLIEYHSENAGHFEDQEGLKKVLAINTSSHHSDKLRKAAGQVFNFFFQDFFIHSWYNNIQLKILQALWQIESNRKHYKSDLGLKKSQFQVT